MLAVKSTVVILDATTWTGVFMGATKKKKKYLTVGIISLATWTVQVFWIMTETVLGLLLYQASILIFRLDEWLDFI